MSNGSIWAIDRTLSGTTTPGQSGPGSDGNQEVLCILQSSKTGASPSNYLISYLGHSLDGRTINSEYYIALLVLLKEETEKKKNPAQNEEEKNARSPRQCTVSQVDPNDGKTTWIAFRIASAPIQFSRSGPQRLLAVCRPKKNALGKKICLPWRSDIGNWGVFWWQRQIVLQKKKKKKRIELLEKRWNQCITLEGDYVDE